MAKEDLKNLPVNVSFVVEFCPEIRDSVVTDEFWDNDQPRNAEVRCS